MHILPKRFVKIRHYGFLSIKRAGNRFGVARWKVY
jgi:hypothetical protein